MEQNTKPFYVYYLGGKAGTTDKIEAHMKSSGLEDVTWLPPTSVHGEIRGLLRVRDSREALEKARDIINRSNGLIRTYELQSIGEPVQVYEVHYGCKSGFIPEVNAAMRTYGMEGIVETPLDWNGNIKGFMRARSIGEAEERAREISHYLTGKIRGMHIKNVSEEQKYETVIGQIRKIFNF